MASNSKHPPWYADGLAFTCRGCGVCCHGPGGYVWLTEEEAGGIAEALGLDFAEFSRRWLRHTVAGLALVDDVHGDCPLLGKDGRCRVYEHRPMQCRTWPWWKDNLVSREAWDDAATRCPGMNTGETHSRVHIESEMAKDF